MGNYPNSTTRQNDRFRDKVVIAAADLVFSLIGGECAGATAYILMPGHLRSTTVGYSIIAGVGLCGAFFAHKENRAILYSDRLAGSRNTPLTL